MKNPIIAFLLGAAVCALIVLVLGEPEIRPTAAAVSADASPLPAQPVDARAPAVSVTQEPSRQRPEGAPSAAPAHSIGSDRVAAGLVKTAEIPGASLGAQAPPPPPLERLLAAFRIDCQYGSGYGGMDRISITNRPNSMARVLRAERAFDLSSS